MKTVEVANALVDALAALRKAEQAINTALIGLSSESPEPVTRHRPAVRTTGTQVMTVLAAASEPLTLLDIADGVVALRRDEDEPKKRGGTRYQEMCRNSLNRLILRGLVRRVEPTTKRDRMRFERTTVTGDDK